MCLRISLLARFSKIATRYCAALHILEQILAEADFKEKCSEVMQKAGFTSVSSVRLAYEEVFDLLNLQGVEAKLRPLNPNSISRPLSSGKLANIKRFSLTLYLISHGKSKTLALVQAQPKENDLFAYKEIYQKVSEDTEVQNLGKLLSRAGLGGVVSPELGIGFFEEKTAFYALRSSRISSEPTHNDVPPKCVLGFMKFSQSEAFSGRAFIYFGEGSEWKRNGNITSAESALINSQGVVVLQYKLERRFLSDPDGNPLIDREGDVKVRLATHESTIVPGAVVFDGQYKDIDPEALNVDGLAYMEVFESSDADVEAHLKQYAEDLLQKVQ